MNLHGFRIKVAIIIFILIIGLGLGFQHFHQQTKIINPLIKQLRELPGVKDLEVEQGFLKKRTQTVLRISLESKVPLVFVVDEIRHTLDQWPGTYGVIFEDEPSTKLWNLLQKIQIATEEAISTGQFTLLEKRVEELANSQGVEWEMAVDANYVYLRLIDGANLLHRITSRSQEQGNVKIYSGRMMTYEQVD